MAGPASVWAVTPPTSLFSARLPSLIGSSEFLDDDGSVASWVSALVVLALLVGFVAVALLIQRRKLDGERRRLRAASVQPRSRVGAVREQTFRIENQVDLWIRTSAGRARDELQRHRAAVRDAAAATEAAAARLSQATPDGIEAASKDHVELAFSWLSDLQTELDRNDHVVGQMLALGARLDHLRVALPAKKELLLTELQHAEALARQRADEGWVVEEPRAELARVGVEVTGCDVVDMVLDLLTLSDRIEQAEAKLFAAQHDLQSLPDRLGSLQTWHDDQAKAIELELRRASQGRQRLAAVQAIHHADSWTWAFDHPSEAERLLHEGSTLGAEAMTASADQRFDDAGRTLERAGLGLIAADDLLDQVDDLIIDLERARVEAPGILAESRRILAIFRQFVETHGSDLDPHIVGRPRHLDEVLDGLDVDLRRPTPNYLRVAQLADRLNRELDDLLASAQAQHQRMGALRRQADRETARAQRNIQRARESVGWELFKSVESENLDQLDRALWGLPTAPVARLEGARNIADHAVAVQERVIARRRRNGNWVSLGGRGNGPGWGGGAVWGGSATGSGSTGGGGGSFGGGRSTNSW